MSIFVAFVLQYWKYAVVLGLLALSLAAGWRLGSANVRADLAAVEARHAEQVADWHRQRAEAAAAVLVRQKAIQADVDSAREELENARARIRLQDADIARLRLNADGLRVKLGAYATGTGSADSLGACQQRAGALANLLAEGSGLLAEGGNLLRDIARAHDERAAEVNALLSAWPKAMSKFIRPNSALDWFTMRQICEEACDKLIEANPRDPTRGRIDFYREVDHMGKRYLVRMKVTIVPAGTI